jgi:hypothetical protein
LRALFPKEGWELVYVNYTNVVVYPAVWLVRKWRAWRPPKAGANPHPRDSAFLGEARLHFWPPPVDFAHPRFEAINAVRCGR